MIFVNDFSDLCALALLQWGQGGPWPLTFVLLFSIVSMSWFTFAVVNILLCCGPLNFFLLAMPLLVCMILSPLVYYNIIYMHGVIAYMTFRWKFVNLGLISPFCYVHAFKLYICTRKINFCKLASSGKKNTCTTISYYYFDSIPPSIHGWLLLQSE